MKPITAETMLQALTKSTNENVQNIALKVMAGESTIKAELKKGRGSFMTAVLKGDYDEAMSRADSENLKVLKELTPEYTIVLTKAKAEELFHNALCNGLGYFCQYGFEMDWKDKEWKLAKASLIEKNPNETPCLEDIMMELMRLGYKLTFSDRDNGGDYTRHLTIKDVHEKVAQTPLRHLNDMLQQQDDADTGDVMIQSVLYNDVVFG